MYSLSVPNLAPFKIILGTLKIYVHHYNSIIMKPTNLKFFGTMFLLSLSIPNQDIFAVNPIRPEDPGSGTGSNNGTMSLSFQMEIIEPISYDILGNNLAVSFNSSIGTATVSIEDQYGAVVYQSVVNTNTQSVLYIPVQGMEPGSYILKVTSESTNFVGYFQL